jgi:hypothetical protein
MFQKLAAFLSSGKQAPNLVGPCNRCSYGARPNSMSDKEMDYSDIISQLYWSAITFARWSEFTSYLSLIHLLVIIILLLHARYDKDPEFFSKSPRRLPSVRQVFVYIALVFLLPPLLSPTSHPVYFISLCPSTHIVAKTRRLEGQRVLPRGEAGHTCTQTDVSLQCLTVPLGSSYSQSPWTIETVTY